MSQPSGAHPFPTHFANGRFFNPNSPPPRGFLDVLRWKTTSRPERSPRFVADVTPSQPPARVQGPELRVTLINHSTVLLQQNGVNILTDPVWSKRVGPLSWLGPARKRDPGVRWEDLPPIDLVLLSHNHYDHLDLPTLRRFKGRSPSAYIAPLGVGALLRAENIGPVHEMDWGDSHTVAGVTIHGAPALHASARGPFDLNRTLWCGYAIESAGQVIYFAGDTAFGAHFAQIRDWLGAPRVALLPIGAYEPRWFMSPVHMSPEEALRAHEILGAQNSIAIHHGTFQLADDGLDTPPRRLRAFGAPEGFLVLHNGQSAVFA